MNRARLVAGNDHSENATGDGNGPRSDHGLSSSIFNWKHNIERRLTPRVKVVQREIELGSGPAASLKSRKQRLGGKHAARKSC